MNIIETKHLSYDYVRRDENDSVVEETRALKDLDLSIEEGSFVCVLGHNGSGKSTFAKLCNGLHLPTEGTILVSGKSTLDEGELLEIRKKTGMVFQNPDNQIIASVVEEDVGFGPENIGVPTEEIWKRVEEALGTVQMQRYRLASPNRLSGGQKQRVAIAGTMAMYPTTIVLDEPTAMLDPSGRKEVIKTIRELNRERGVTILLITHYMEETVDADRIIVMDQGRLVMDGSPKEVFSEVEVLKSYRMAVPEVTELVYRLRKDGLPLPEGILRKKEFIRALAPIVGECTETEAGAAKDENPLKNGKCSQTEPKTESNTVSGKGPVCYLEEEIKDAILRVEGVSHIYQEGTAMERAALEDVSFSVERGSVTAVIGHTGSGKSTLTQHLNGLLHPSRGHIYVNFQKPLPPAEKKTKKQKQEEKQFDRTSVPAGFQDIADPRLNKKALCFRIGLCFQYPEHQLFEVDVLQDVMFGPKNQGLSLEEAKEKAELALRRVGLPEELWTKSPFELSGGQKRRVAIAGILAMQPEVLILDEPTAGLDPAGRDDLFRQIKELHDTEGMTILLVSHSMDDVARFSDHVLALDKGRIRLSGTTEQVFSHDDILEEMGLGLPQMQYLVREMRKSGIPVPKSANTVELVERGVLELYHKEKPGKEAEGC